MRTGEWEGEAMPDQNEVPNYVPPAPSGPARFLRGLACLLGGLAIMYLFVRLPNPPVFTLAGLGAGVVLTVLGLYLIATRSHSRT